jgi:hypothetical protein
LSFAERLILPDASNQLRFRKPFTVRSTLASASPNVWVAHGHFIEGSTSLRRFNSRETGLG